MHEERKVSLCKYRLYINIYIYNNLYDNIYNIYIIYIQYIYIYVCIYKHTNILTLYAFFCVKATTYKLNDKIFKIGLNFEFYKSLTDFVKVE